jgi:hypothetical protein
MKLGAENPKKVLVVLLFFALAVGFALREIFSTSTSAAAAPVAAPQTAQSAPKQASLLNSLDPSLRFDLLKASQDVNYKGSGRNIFNAEPEPPPVPKVQQPVLVYGPPKAPPPPPINLKFYGFASSAGGAKRVFLSENGDIFIAKEGDIVDRHYRVGHITPNSVEITDVLNNNTQTIPLTEAPTGAGGPS